MLTGQQLVHPDLYSRDLKSNSEGHGAMTHCYSLVVYMQFVQPKTMLSSVSNNSDFFSDF